MGHFAFGFIKYDRNVESEGTEEASKTSMAATLIAKTKLSEKLLELGIIVNPTPTIQRSLHPRTRTVRR